MIRRSVPVVIFAGGQGIRIGGDKTAQLLQGQSLMDHILRKAGRFSDQIAVAVGGQYDVQLPPHIAVLQDEHAGSGPISGLASALKFAASGGHDFVLTMPCDTPFLPDDLFEMLEASLDGSCATIVRSDGKFHPACGLWRADAERQLPAYLAGGRRSLIGFAEHIGYAAAEWNTEPFDPFFNINTLADLAHAEHIAKFYSGKPEC